MTFVLKGKLRGGKMNYFLILLSLLNLIVLKGADLTLFQKYNCDIDLAKTVLCMINYSIGP